ncbi:MAG: N-acetylmuramoyl-L-alanine amidase [Lachnospiraceae bacterium]|nr:N-acetylmuramoyl-L-alanine amidase [Lachnospiraceae bacterium]
MQSTVHKKNSELALWEMDARRGKTANRAGRNRSRSSQTANRTSTKTIHVIEPTARPKHYYQSPNMAQINERRIARRRRAYFYRALAFAMLASIFVLMLSVVGFIFKFMGKEQVREASTVKSTPIIKDVEEPKIAKPDITVDLLEVNDYSRPATELNEIKSIFVHYTANPGTSAKQNRSYFSNLSETHERSASAHFIVGYEGEIIQCIPMDEQAYAVMTRNEDSISIECCYLDKDGQFTQETYDSLIHLLAWLKQEYNLNNEDILRHYDCGGKLCPIYYVENEGAWDKLLRDVSRFEEEQ